MQSEFYYLPVPTRLGEVLKAARPQSVVVSDTGIHYLVLTEEPNVDFLVALLEKAHQSGLNFHLTKMPGQDKYICQVAANDRGLPVSGLNNSCLYVLGQLAQIDPARPHGFKTGNNGGHSSDKAMLNCGMS